MMNDEFKSPLSEIDNAGGQRAKRGGSTFAKATARQVRSHHRLEGSLSGGGGEPPGRDHSHRTANFQHRKAGQSHPKPHSSKSRTDVLPSDTSASRRLAMGSNRRGFRHDSLQLRSVTGPFQPPRVWGTHSWHRFPESSCSAARACQRRQDFGGVAGQERCDGQAEAGEDAAESGSEQSFSTIRRGEAGGKAET
jgi:hypothetical protein